MTRPIVTAITATAFLGSLVPLPTPPPVPQGQPYDLVLTAHDTFGSPMIDVDLTGVFSGPGGQELVLPGFWDGDRTFRIRFTPTVPGRWTYSTVSGDPGLDAQMGVIEAAAAEPGAVGFARAGIPAARRSIAACEPDCAALFGATEFRPDLPRLRLLDTTVADAERAGVLVDVRLFARETTSMIDDLRVRGVIEYLVARYAAFPNVVWCAGAPAARTGAGSRAALRGFIRTLDLYYAVGQWRRPVLASCDAAAATS